MKDFERFFEKLKIFVNLGNELYKALGIFHDQNVKGVKNEQSKLANLAEKTMKGALYGVSSITVGIGVA